MTTCPCEDGYLLISSHSPGCSFAEPLEPFDTQAEQQAAEEAMRKAAGIDIQPMGDTGWGLRTGPTGSVYPVTPHEMKAAGINACIGTADCPATEHIDGCRAGGGPMPVAYVAAGIDGERERLREQVLHALMQRRLSQQTGSWGDLADAVIAEVVDPLLAKIRVTEGESEARLDALIDVRRKRDELLAKIRRVEELAEHLSGFIYESDRQLIANRIRRALGEQ